MAARAGDAGKGFAVLAHEVKELAKGTAKATDEVSESIAAIQRDTQESVGGIKASATVTNQIREKSQSIAAAVEEQTATTNEMGRYVSEAAGTAAAIASEMEGLAEAARSTSAGAKQTECRDCGAEQDSWSTANLRRNVQDSSSIDIERQQ